MDMLRQLRFGVVVIVSCDIIICVNMIDVNGHHLVHRRELHIVLSVRVGCLVSRFLESGKPLTTQNIRWILFTHYD